MPNNIAGRGLTDREYLQLCLELEKGRCRTLSNTLLEINHQELREIFLHCFETAHKNQYNLFDFMKNKGWYRTTIASQPEIEIAQKNIQHNLQPDS